MRMFHKQNCKYIGAAALLLGLLVFVGCTTTRKTPSPIPRFVTGYRNPAVYKKFKRLAVKLELREFKELESCIMTTGTKMGGTAFELVPFKTIVESEFMDLISKNFLNASEKGVKAKVVLEVLPRVHEIERNDLDEVKCTVEFYITLYAPRTDYLASGRIYKEIYKETVEYHDIEGLYPCSLYAAVQKIVKSFISDLPHNPDLMSALGDLLVGHGDIIYEDPIPKKVGQTTYYNEVASVKCNDDERDDVEKWAKGVIWDRGRRYFKSTRYCVFFSPSLFDDETRRLDLHYDIIGWDGFIMIPDSDNGRFGRCFIDCHYFRVKDVETAKKSMRNLLLRRASEKGASYASVELKDYREDKDNPGFCKAEYEFR